MTARARISLLEGAQTVSQFPAVTLPIAGLCHEPRDRLAAPPVGSGTALARLRPPDRARGRLPGTARALATTGLRGNRGHLALYDCDLRDRAAHDADRRGSRSRRPRTRLPGAAQTGRRLARSVRSGGLRRVRGARVPLGHRDVRRLHQARRHRDLAGIHRPSARPRAQLHRTRSLHVRSGDLPVLRRRLSSGSISAARRGARTARHRLCLDLPAVHGVPRGHAGARNLRSPGPSDRIELPSRDRRLRRRAACAALRLFAVGRREGGRGGGDHRSHRRAHPGRAAAGRPATERICR